MYKQLKVILNKDLVYGYMVKVLNKNLTKPGGKVHIFPSSFMFTSSKSEHTQLKECTYMGARPRTHTQHKFSTKAFSLPYHAVIE